MGLRETGREEETIKMDTSICSSRAYWSFQILKQLNKHLNNLMGIKERMLNCNGILKLWFFNGNIDYFESLYGCAENSL